MKRSGWLLIAGFCTLLLACIPDPVTPNWFDQFVAVADTSSAYPLGTSVQRCYWEDQWVYQIDNPLSSCFACYVLTTVGDTISFDGTTEQLDYLENRKRCEEIWRKE